MAWWGNDGGEDVQVRVDPTALIVRLERMGGNAKTLNMDHFAALMVGAIDDTFQSEGAKGTDGPWEPFAEETLRRHPRRIGGLLLQDTGATANVQVREAGELKVVIASPTDYSQWHIVGTANMPRRDFFALHFDDLLEELGNLALMELQR